MNDDDTYGNDTVRHLKQVSRIKHLILEKYLPAWGRILGSKSGRLCYFDCYAGPGVYEFQGEVVDGSPLIAVRVAQRYLDRARDREMTLTFVEKDGEQRASLESQLRRLEPYDRRLQVYVVAEDAREFIPNLLARVQNLAPSFFMVDPYGHPLTVPILNTILRHARTEALITFMYYRINMDAGNPKVQGHLDRTFGTREWRTQPFLRESGWKRERGFLEYFLSQVEARYKLPFRIRFDIEDQVPQNRTKYYLVHASNHPKAVLLMKEVMWPLGDEEGIFDFSGGRQGTLFPGTPREEELRQILLREYAGQEVSFDSLREQTWYLPFIEKHYRTVIKQLREEGRVSVTPVSSKTGKGLAGEDLVRFLVKEGSSG